MKRMIFIAIMLASFLLECNAQSSVEDYNRSSLYSISVLHPGTEFYSNILETMVALQPPERYNDHNLSLRAVISRGDTDSKDFPQKMAVFLEKNQVARRLVSKWFNRNKISGAFNMDIIRQRGSYNASVEDVNLANRTARGTAMLEDAGENLIGNTFVIINDIDYIDKSGKTSVVAAVLEVASLAATTVSAFSGSRNQRISSALIGAASGLGSVITDQIAGFTVRIHSYLYKLRWDNEIAGNFYGQYYFDSTSVNVQKRLAYGKEKNLFKLEYLGDYEARSGKTILKGLKEPSDVFKKVLSRAIDENIVQLRRKFPVFKVSCSVYEVEDDQVKLHIGLKEGITSSSRFEVLERREDSNGKLSYRRVATLAPVDNQIWDNRSYAVEEEADNAGLTYSTFRIVSGSDILPGMLVREIK